MKKIKFGAVFLLILLLAGASVIQAEQTYEVGNGLFLVGNKDTSVDLVSFCLLIKTGYANEPKDKRGLALLTNEFLGNIFSAYGNMYVGVSTFNDYSLWQGMVPSQKIEDLLDTVRQFFSYNELAFDFDAYLRTKEDLEYEVNDVLEMGLQKFLKEFYGERHPYYHPLSKEDIGKITPDDLMTYYQKWYCPSRTVLSLGGKYVEKDGGLNRLGGVLGYIEEREKLSAKDKKIEITQPSLKEPKEFILEGKANIGAIVVGFSAPLIDTEEFYAMLVINEYLNGMGGELYRKLRHEKGLTYHAECYYNPAGYKEAPFTAILLKIMPANMNTALRDINDILGQIQINGIPEAKLKEITDGMKNSRDIWSKDMLYDSYRNALYYSFKWQFLKDERYTDNLKKVTQEKIKETARKYFKNGILVKVMPAKDKME